MFFVFLLLVSVVLLRFLFFRAKKTSPLSETLIYGSQNL